MTEKIAKYGVGDTRVHDTGPRIKDVLDSGNGAKGILSRTPPGNRVLTNWAALTVGELDEGPAELLGAIPWVPDGDGPRATYPYRPADSSPHFSYGYPGQATLHEPVEDCEAGI